MSLSKKVNLQFTAIQSSYWISFVPLGGFAVVLLQSKSFTDSEIGILLAMQSIASIVAQPLISAFAGRHPDTPLKKIISIMLLLGAAAASIFYFLPHLFLPAVLIFAAIGMTHYSAPAFLNAMAMQLTNAGIKMNYGAARGIGSISFALIGVALGKLVDISGTNIILPFFVIVLLITSVLVTKIYAPPPREKQTVDVDAPAEMPQTNLLEFLRKNKQYTGFCIASAFLFACHSCINSFLPNITGPLGGTITDQGIIRGISAAFELPIMFFYSFIASRISSHKLLIFSALSFFLKSLTTMIAPSMSILFLIQAFQLPAFGLYTPAAVHFSDKSVLDVDRVRAQAISMAVGVGLGNVIGNLGGGFVLDKLGLHSMLIVSTVLGFIGFLIMFFVLHERRGQTVLSNNP
jgi:PPP family 3-phenylpropionic acid transporter